MMRVFVAFVLVGLCFWGPRWRIAGVWPYYVPVTLTAVLLWMHGIELRNRRIACKIVRLFPDLLSAQEREMLLGSPSLFISDKGSPRDVFSGCGMSCVVQTVVATALAYSAVAACIQAWLPLMFSTCLFLYGLLSPLANAFRTSYPVDNEARAVDRCLSRRRRKDRRGNRTSPQVPEDFGICYWRTLSKLYEEGGPLSGRTPLRLSAPPTCAAVIEQEAGRVYDNKDLLPGRGPANYGTA